jgi:hypothetical protein
MRRRLLLKPPNYKNSDSDVTLFLNDRRLHRFVKPGGHSTWDKAATSSFTLGEFQLSAFTIGFVGFWGDRETVAIAAQAYASFHLENVAACPHLIPSRSTSCQTIPSSIQKRRPDFAILSPR